MLKILGKLSKLIICPAQIRALGSRRDCGGIASESPREKAAAAGQASISLAPTRAFPKCRKHSVIPLLAGCRTRLASILRLHRTAPDSRTVAPGRPATALPSANRAKPSKSPRIPRSTARLLLPRICAKWKKNQNVRAAVRHNSAFRIPHCGLSASGVAKAFVLA